MNSEICPYDCSIALMSVKYRNHALIKKLIGRGTAICTSSAVKLNHFNGYLMSKVQDYMNEYVGYDLSGR